MWILMNFYIKFKHFTKKKTEINFKIFHFIRIKDWNCMQKWNGRFMTLPDEKLCLCVRSSHTHTHTHTDATGGNIWILSGPDQTAFIWAGSGLDNESWLPFLFRKFSSGPFGRARHQALAICFTDTHTRAKCICVALCRPGMRRMRVYFISSFFTHF